MVESTPHKKTLLSFLFLKFIFQNFVFGLLLALFVKQFFSFYQLPYFSFIEGSLVFAFVLGILSAGYLSEFLGRKFLANLAWTILCVTLLFLVMLHDNPLIWTILGFSFFALGIFITIFPIYVAECAPSLRRGAWVVTNFLVLLLGFSVFAGTDLNYLIDQHTWFMLGNALSVLALLVSYYSLESPSWLIEQGRLEEAKTALLLLRAKEEIEKEIAVTRSSIRRRPRSWQRIYERQLKNKLKISLHLAIFRQLTGIGVMLFYLPHLFMQRWTVEFSVLWMLIFISLSAGLLFSAIYIDSTGRRRLTTFSFLFQGIILLALALSWKVNLQHHGLKETVHELILLLSFLFFFALGSGPITWLSWIELMPLRSRARYLTRFLLMTLILGVLVWVGYYLLINLFGIQLFYVVVAIFAFVAAIYCWRKMPETKHYLLDEI